MRQAHILKTSVEIADSLARKAKAHAARNNITLRALIERGLRMAMREDEEKQRFTLRDASVGGHGLQSEYRDADWARLRAAAYEDRDLSEPRSGVRSQVRQRTVKESGSV